MPYISTYLLAFLPANAQSSSAQEIVHKFKSHPLPSLIHFLGGREKEERG